MWFKETTVLQNKNKTISFDGSFYRYLKKTFLNRKILWPNLWQRTQNPLLIKVPSRPSPCSPKKWFHNYTNPTRASAGVQAWRTWYLTSHLFPRSLCIKWFSEGLCPPGSLRFSRLGLLLFLPEHTGKVGQEHKACQKPKHLGRRKGKGYRMNFEI